MSSNSLRLETKVAFLGWTSELPGAQYAAWIKFLQAVKAFGRRGGVIEKTLLTDKFLRRYHISRRAFSEMINKAQVADGNGPAVTETLLEFAVTHWNTYQLDTTARSRQQKLRVKDVTGDAVTQQATFDDFWNAWPEHIRKQAKARARERWDKFNLDSIGTHVVGVVEAMKKSKQWKDKGGQYIPAPEVWLNKKRWDCDLDKLKVAIAREGGGGGPRATGLSTRDREIKELLASGGVLSPEMRVYWDKKQGKEPKR